MLIVRLKQLEHALSDGRLDLGYEFARAADLRADRRGQALVNRLAYALAQRGKEHIDAGRIAEAAADCEKAAGLAGNLIEVAQLRAAVANATAAKIDADRVRAGQIAAARRQIDAGQLTLGQALLAPLDKDQRAEAMQNDLAARRARLKSAIAKATAAMQMSDWQVAIDHLAGLCAQFPADAELAALAARLTQHVTGLISDAINQGRLDLAGLYLSKFDAMDRPAVEIEPLRRTLSDCRRALGLISAGQTGPALEILRRVAMVWPEANWLRDACEHLRRADEALDALRSGPLGLMSQVTLPVDTQETIAMSTPVKAIVQPAIAKPPRGAGPQGRFVMHVDGVASFVVMEQPTVTIGPAQASVAADLQLMAAGGAPQVTLTRTDGDYLLQSLQPVEVNDKPTTGKVLTSGDKIALGPRCRLAFRRPSAASGTAILDLTGTRLMRGDVRQVILLDREILIGPGAGAHIRCDGLAQMAVLQPSGAKLLLRSSEPIQINGQPVSSPADIAPGAHVRLGFLSFVVGKE